jgi:zinc protease
MEWQSIPEDVLLPWDPTITMGRLTPSGMRYAIQHNAYPPNRVVAYLEVNTGSINETNEEQGVSATTNFHTSDSYHH